MQLEKKEKNIKKNDKKEIKKMNQKKGVCISIYSARLSVKFILASSYRGCSLVLFPSSPSSSSSALSGERHKKISTHTSTHSSKRDASFSMCVCVCVEYRESQKKKKNLGWATRWTQEWQSRARQGGGQRRGREKGGFISRVSPHHPTLCNFLLLFFFISSCLEIVFEGGQTYRNEKKYIRE